MFILRKIDETQRQSNLSIGKNYSFIHRETSYEEFCNCFKMVYGRDYDKDAPKLSSDDKVYAFIANSNGELLPLIKQHRNYVMTESGKTFANVNY